MRTDAQLENLKKGRRYNSETGREAGRKGGIASGEAKRRKKTMKELFQYVGGLTVTDEKLKAKMREMGIPEDDITWSAALAVATIMTAIKKNDIKTVEFVLEMMENDAGGIKWDV